MKPIIISVLRQNRGITASIIFCFVLTIRASAAQLYAWTIDDIYSSADGSVQFIELETQPAPGGLLGSGYQFNTWNPSATLSHSYATPVSQFSGGGYQFLLFATTGFTLLPGAITPDYIIPNGFLFTPAGKLTVQTIDGSFSSSLTYSDLPTDGIHALNVTGNVVPAIAENFAGRTYVVPEPSAFTLLVIGFTLMGVGFGKRLDIATQNSSNKTP